MATTSPNPVVDRDWDVYVDAGDEFTLSVVDAVAVEWRVTADDTPIATAISGHTIDPREREGLNRALTGPGYVQLRIAPSQQTDTSAEIAVTIWSD